MCFRVNPKSTLFQCWIWLMNQRWQIDVESMWIGYHVDRRRDVISTYINVESTLSVCWERTLKETDMIWKNFQNIRTTPAIMGNGTFILLHSNVSKHTTESFTPQYQSNYRNLVSGTAKRLDVLKNYQNIRKTPPVLENGTFIQLYSEVPNHPDWANTSEYHWNNHNFGFGNSKH